VTVAELLRARIAPMMCVVIAGGVGMQLGAHGETGGAGLAIAYLLLLREYLSGENLARHALALCRELQASAAQEPS
jgi:hypothetical protein